MEKLQVEITLHVMLARFFRLVVCHMCDDILVGGPVSACFAPERNLAFLSLLFTLAQMTRTCLFITIAACGRHV